jgi:hypothetical protein
MNCASAMRPRSQGPAYNARMTKFTVIDGTPPPDTPKQRVTERIKKMPKPASMLQCRRCGGREVLELKSGVLYQDGRTKGGIKTIVCATCFMRGERMVLA